MIWATSKHNSSYSISKFRSEMEVWRGVEEGLNAVIVNPVIILGPGFWNRGSSSIFERVAGGLKYGTPGMTGYVGVEDVVTAMTRLMDSDISGERFILSAGDYTYAELFELVAEALGQPRKMRSLSPALLSRLERMDAFRAIFTGKRSLTPEQVRSAFNKSRYSSHKVREAIGLEFTPIREVVEQVAAYYLADSARRSNK
jgi:nucleoside-diphosphate-sugar epimerase